MSFQFVQGRTSNHLTWCFVDATDFATRESAMSAAAKIKIYGTVEGATGVNFVSSGTGSLTNDIVHVGASANGVYHIALAKADLSDASAAWYDEYIVVLSATGAAYETMIVEGIRTDTSYMSNVLSHLSAITSDVYSALVVLQSRALLTQSRVSDVGSLLSDILSGVRGNSDALSAAQAYRATMSGVQSDVYSALVVLQSRALLTQSRVSDIGSLLSDILSGVRGNSDAISATRGYLATMSGIQSDIYSLLTAGPIINASDMSDLRSAIAAVTVTIGASDVSDIASAVLAGLTGLTASDLSDIASVVWAHATGVRVDSRLKLVQSNVSDVQSFLVVMSAVQSDLYSAMLVTQSAASDAMSAAQQTNSRALVNQSVVSDLYSLLQVANSNASDAMSAAQQGNSRALVNQSVVSDIYSALLVTQSQASDVYSLLVVANSNASDAMSAAQQGNSRALVNQSVVSDIYSLLQVTNSNASDAMSAAQQGNSRVLLNQSRISDIASFLVVMSAVQSDLYSLLSDVGSDLTVMSGVQSDLYSLLSDFASDFGSRIPATIPELTTDPGATPTLPQALALQYMWLRNNSKSTSAKRSLRNNAGTTVLSATHSDDGTSYLQGKLG